MTALTQPDEALPETTTIIQVIERAALNPNVDIDKMERLLMMQERIMERNARMAYTTALATMQPLLPVIGERGGIENKAGDVQSTYALWEDINDAIRPFLSEYGFALSFRTGQAEDGRIRVTGVLSHREGHQEETTITLPHDSSGSKNAVQAVGSSTSYGKRYTAMALLNLTSRGEDDDGTAGGKLPSAHSAKKNGMGERANELMHEIAGLEGLGACTAWANARSAEIATLPAKWQDMLREELIEQKRRIKEQDDHR